MTGTGIWLLCALFLRDQAFTCKGNTGSHGRLLQAGNQRLLVVVEVHRDNAQ